MIKNAAGRFIPESLPGLGILKPYVGPFDYVPDGRKVGPKIAVDKPRSDKILKSIDQAIEATGLKDGMTISRSSFLFPYKSARLCFLRFPHVMVK